MCWIACRTVCRSEQCCLQGKEDLSRENCFFCFCMMLYFFITFFAVDMRWSCCLLGMLVTHTMVMMFTV